MTGKDCTILWNIKELLKLWSNNRAMGKHWKKSLKMIILTRACRTGVAGATVAAPIILPKHFFKKNFIKTNFITTICVHWSGDDNGDLRGSVFSIVYSSKSGVYIYLFLACFDN